jgi:hypothetical protein
MSTMYSKIIYITAMPRTGSTWVGQLFAAHPEVRLKYCPLFSYEFRGRCDERSPPGDWRGMFDELYERKSDYLDQEHLRTKGDVPTFDNVNPRPPVMCVKSNRFHTLTRSMVSKLPEITWIALARDPVTTIASWVLNPTEFVEPCTVDADWRSGECRRTRPGEHWGFADWLWVTAMHAELATAHPDRFTQLHYEDLSHAPVEAAKRLLDIAGLSHDPQVLEFARSSQAEHSAQPRSVFKNPRRSASRYDTLPAGIVAAMLAETREAGLERFLRPPAGV